MITYRQIDDFSIGDTYNLIRILDSVPDERHITDAYWTVKAELTDADVNAMMALHITTSGLVGEVTNYIDGTTRLYFTATPEDSYMMSPLATYYYDIHVNLDSGAKYCLETGKLFTGSQVTQIH